MQSALSKSSSKTVPLPTPSDCSTPMLVVLVAHIRTIRKIVGAILAYKELVGERSFVRGASGRIEICHVRIGQSIEMTAYGGEASSQLPER